MPKRKLPLSIKSNKKRTAPKAFLEAGKKHQFKPGPDPRRNSKGRPKNFDQFRKLAQHIAALDATTRAGQPIEWNAEQITFAEQVLYTWLEDPKLIQLFAEAAFGKVPSRATNVNIDFEALSDEQLERIAAGEDPLKVMSERNGASDDAAVDDE